ncbi:MAG TPA: ribosome biogenesis GTPase Der, partial [Synergistaceae bacterium]|nr:ribosome biogenesis GTPase Der [Synergistaceae bacterium]
YAEVGHKEESFYMVDTGGILGEQSKNYDEQIRKQAEIAIEESDLVLFLVDAQTGLMPTDHDIALLARKSHKPVVLVINKADSPYYQGESQFASLGFEQILPVSAVHNKNIEELLDIISQILENCKGEKLKELSRDPSILSVALVGRPNVGKSSIFNHFVGQERSLVSSVPGTTRDSIDTLVETPSGLLRIIDTAGLRKKSRISSAVEYYSMVRSYNAIDRCDVAILVMDGEEPATENEKKICGHVAKKGKGLVFAVNKWDLAPRDPKVGDNMRKYLKQAFVFFQHAPMIFVSAKTGRNMPDLSKAIFQIHENRKARISTSKLNVLLRELMAFERMPSNGQGRFLKLYYCTQAETAPPFFLFVVNDKDIVTKQFERHVEKKLRSLENYSGVPIRIKWKNRSD